jgi:hypothetical protein
MDPRNTWPVGFDAPCTSLASGSAGAREPRRGGFFLPLLSRCALRNQLTDALIREKGEAWVREHRDSLDAQWEQMIAAGLV